VEAPRIGIHKRIRLWAIVAKLDEPERSRFTGDRAADFLTDLTSQGVENRLGSLSVSPRQDVRTVLVEQENRTAGAAEDRARRDDELEGRLLLGQVARQE
jgi:hypothetical protein